VLKRCDAEVDGGLTAQLYAVAKAWCDSPSRPRPGDEVIRAWEQLIADWASSEDLPLLVRRAVRGMAMGSVTVHESGRSLVPCDNSPAQWVFCLAMRGMVPSLEEVRSLLESDQVPVSMVRTKQQRVDSIHKCTLSGSPEWNLNTLGWKLAHIDKVGLGTRRPIESVPMNKITDHFKRFLSPSNMFVVPLSSAGFAETVGALRAFGNRQTSP